VGYEPAGIPEGCYKTIAEGIEMKELKEMSTEELIDYVAGRLCISIGHGDFRSEVCLWVMSLQSLGYQNGFEAGKKFKSKK
jgi:hypothetical protein